MTHVHMIGIGGTGLSAIAKVLLESGTEVSGSDRQMSPLAQVLQEAGVRIFIGHQPENIAGANLVLRSSAVPDDNVEVQEALKKGIPVMKRAEFLGSLMEGRLGIGIAGTHGKTTTTAMLAWILSELDQDPTFIIGGVSLDLGTNARAGKGQIFLIEADEYDRMFLGLTPRVAVVTNIEHDHPDCYPTPESFFEAFQEFARQVPPEGVLIGCAEDPSVRELLQMASTQGIHTRTYGLSHQELDSTASFDYTAHSPVLDEDGCSFEFITRGKSGINGSDKPASPVSRIYVSLKVPGKHNLLNALAALAVIDWLGLPLDMAARALERFTGTGRRFQVLGDAQGVTVIDDYAHHPTEIRATLAAARARFPTRRLWAVWQPHTYSRTLGLLDQFAGAFVDVDRVLVTGIYAARESAPQNSTPEAVGAKVSEAIRHPSVLFIQDLDQAASYLLHELEAGDVLLVLSAGDADRISRVVYEGLQNRLSGASEAPLSQRAGGRDE